jgi:hypothetical protein
MTQAGKDRRQKNALWVNGFSPDDARVIAALATVTFATPAARYAPIAPSPWRSDAMVTCVLDTPAFDVPLGTAATAAGRPFPRT